MARDNPISRRTALKATGATAAAALVAGCGGGGGNGGENGDESGGGGSSDAVEIEPGTQIEFEAATSEWTGIAPSSIEGESNPTLSLQAGETYEIGWTEGDGSQHNIEVRNEDDSVVDDLSTEQVSEPEDQWLEFEASEEMAAYVCAPHEQNMRGELQVEAGGNGGGNGNETEGGNETENGEENATENETEE